MSLVLSCVAAAVALGAGGAPLARRAPAGPRLAEPGCEAPRPAGPESEGSADAWFGEDKVKHFFIAGFVQSVSYGGVRATGASHRTSLAVAWATTAAVSIGKEVVDERRRGLFSVRDLAWDAAGATVATVILNQVRRR
jgi:uncharacterized protein YfiM (DUF2279 family)